jgi:hypothetical protein
MQVRKQIGTPDPKYPDHYDPDLTMLPIVDSSEVAWIASRALSLFSSVVIPDHLFFNRKQTTRKYGKVLISAK